MEKHFKTKKKKSDNKKVSLGIKQLDFFFDDELIGTDTTRPYQFTFSLPSDVTDGKHTITVKAYDKADNRQGRTVIVFVE